MENQIIQPEANAADVETVQLPRLQHQYLNISLIMNTLIANPEPFELEQVYEVLSLPRQKIKTRFSLAVDSRCPVRSVTLTRFDQAVMDAVYTLSVNGCETFTTSMVARVISGNLSRDVTLNMRKAVEMSIEKLRSVWIRIDCAAELKARKIQPDWKPEEFQSFLLPVKDVAVRSGNNQTITQGYALRGESVLYVYAETIHQMASVPADCLETHSVRDTQDNIVIKRYLLRRIEALRNRKSKVRSPKISYEWRKNKGDPARGFLQDLGYDRAGYSNWRDKKSRIHAAVTGLLKDFAASGYIDGFKVCKSGSGIQGVEIILDPKASGR